MAIIDYIPSLAAQLGVAFFEEKLGAMCIRWLSDCVFTIRESAIENIKKMIDLFGLEWGTQHLIPEVLRTSSNDNYFFRLTVLSAIATLGSIVDTELLCGKMLPLVLQMGNDQVPNVRFNVAKTLQALIPVLEPGLVQQQVKPRLLELTEDADSDVQYFANQALQCC